MVTRLLHYGVAITVLCLFTACVPIPSDPTAEAELPNPASVNCEENGGNVDLRADPAGGVVGICVFPDGSECEEWAYLRGDCRPGESLVGAATQEPGPSLDMANPASLYCQQQGYQSQIVTAADGSQSGICVFPDGSYCDEWAYFRGECGPVEDTSDSSTDSSGTPPSIDPSEIQGWWTYVHPSAEFSILLPPSWVVREETTADGVLNGHLLTLRPEDETANERIRMTFRSVGDETPLWPTGVGEGEFVEGGTLEIGGIPARRVLLVCPSGEITSIWYHQDSDTPHVTRGDMEFGFIFSATPSHCESGYGLGGKVQRMGEVIISSLTVPDTD